MIDAYVPALVRRPGRAGPGGTSLRGTFVSADLSGFTALSERLAEHGRRGAEVLAGHVDACFTRLIDEITPLGGDVVFFGGDALFLVFTGSDHGRRAVAAGRAMHRSVSSYPPIETPTDPVALSLSVGVASGTAQLVVAGGPHESVFLIGPAIDRTLDMESAATAGELLMSRATERASRGPDGPHGEVPEIATDPARPVQLPLALRDRIVAGDTPRNHRLVAVAFVTISIPTRLPALARIDRLMESAATIGRLCDTMGVCWVSTDVTHGGAKAVLVAGVPDQSDDDEVRLATLAHLAVGSEIGRWLQIGLHSGTAFVGDIGHPQRRTYTVMGDTVNTSARLMGTAERGQAMASDAFVASLRGAFDLGDTRSITVKGKREPLMVRAVRGPADGPEVRRAGTRRPDPVASGVPIGRDGEFEVLAALDTTGGMIDLVGAPGIGKSDLVDAFVTTSRRPTLRVTATLPSSVVPFRALTVALGAGLDDPVAATARLDDPFATLLAPVLGHAMGATVAAGVDPGSVAEQRARLLTSLVRGSWTDDGLLIVDDVHWLDESSRTLLRDTAIRLADLGWAVVTSSRPGTPPLCDEMRRLAIGPLDATACRRLALVEAGAAGLSDRALAAIIERSDGVPLFVQQLVRSHLDGGLDALPGSAERIIGARIDALDAGRRHALQSVSVLGESADLDLVEAVVGHEAVRRLVDLGDFLEVTGGSVHFRHDLIRLAAYEGLAFDDREHLHAATATVLSRRDGTPPSVLAEHWARAGEHDLAVELAVIAARSADAEIALADAVRLWRLAADSALRAGRSAAERVAYLSALGHGHETLAEPDRAEAVLRKALQLTAGPESAELHLRLGWIALRADDVDQAAEHTEIAWRASDRPLDVARTLLLRSAVRAEQRRSDDSDEDARTARRIAVDADLAEPAAEALLQLALNADARNEATDGIAHEAAAALDACRRHLEVGLLWLNLGVGDLQQGRWGRAEERLRDADRACRRSGHVLFGLFVDANLGGLLLEQGRPIESATLFTDTARRARAARNRRLADFADAGRARAEAWSGSETAADEILDAHRRLVEHGDDHEAQDVAAYAVEALVLVGRCVAALDLSGPLLEEIERDRPGDVVTISLRRLRIVAQHEMSGADARSDTLECLLALGAHATDEGALIEHARIMQALTALTPEPDPTWWDQGVADARRLGVVWLPAQSPSVPAAAVPLPPASDHRVMCPVRP